MKIETAPKTPKMACEICKAEHLPCTYNLNDGREACPTCAKKVGDAEKAAAAPVKTWRDELAAGVFEDGLTDAGLDRHDFKDISKQTLKAIIDAAYSRGLAEATRDARLPHNR